MSHAQVKSAILVKFGQRVRQERTTRKLSQEQLAELAGVHRTYIGMIERGEKNITLESIEKLAKALELKPEELLRTDL
ncbi:MAG: helix-turn-helix domain-containing protein [Syntrophobacteraceae bacterium]